MKIITGARRSGKSTHIARWVLEDRENRGVIVGNVSMANYFQELGLDSREIHVCRPDHAVPRGTNRKYAIDELNSMLSFFFPSVELVSITSDTLLTREELFSEIQIS